LAWWSRNRIGVRAGLRVSELNADRTVLTTMVTANCLKNWPVSPGMTAAGTNTAQSTSDTPMIAVPTSDMAFSVATFGESPRAM